MYYIKKILREKEWKYNFKEKKEQGKFSDSKTEHLYIFKINDSGSSNHHDILPIHLKNDIVVQVLNVNIH